MLPPLRLAMSPAPALFPLGGALAVFLVAVVTLAGATPLPRPRADLPGEPPVADMSKKTTQSPGVEVQQHKRQIFREQVSPHTGGKIPEDAFRADRLALNKLQQAGFSVPDGMLLHWRGHGQGGDPGHHGHGPHGHPDGHTHTTDPHLSVIKILQTDEGRYVPPEGQSHQSQNTVDSTYLLRTPAGWDQHAAQLVGLQRPVGPPLQLPGAGGASGGGGDLPRRPFVPQQHKPGPTQSTSPPVTPQPLPPPRPPPPPPPPQQQHPQDDVNLTPYPSPALQPPPPPSGLYHHNQGVAVHPLEVPQPPKAPTGPSRPPPRHRWGQHVAHALHPTASSGPARDLGLFSSGLGSSLSSGLGSSLSTSLGSSLSSGLGSAPGASFRHGSLSELHEDESLLGDSAFLLDDDWASELPGGLLSPEQLSALYNSDHEDRLQHLHSLTSF